MVFGMSLMPTPDWRLMLGVLSIPSLIYFGLTVFYLPESPRWLVSKGRMAEAKRVLQRLRGREDVSGLYDFARYSLYAAVVSLQFC
jgi:MFS family permease